MMKEHEKTYIYALLNIILAQTSTGVISVVSTITGIILTGVFGFLFWLDKRKHGWG